MRALGLLSALALLAAAGQATAAESGQSLFSANCEACHQADGKGIAGAFPPLAANPLVLGDPEPLALVILDGRGGMPTFKSELNDEQLAAVASFIRSSWGNKAPAVVPGFVGELRAKLAKEPPINPLQMH